MDSNATTNGTNQPSLDDLIPLSKAAKISGLTQPHLALMIRKGRLWGRKIGRNWVTTEQSVKEYLALDRKPGPKHQNSS